MNGSFGLPAELYPHIWFSAVPHRTASVLYHSGEKCQGFFSGFLTFLLTQRKRMRDCAFHSLACIPPGRGMGNHLWTERFCRKSNLCLKVRIPDYLSLRTSPLKWCGNPPVRKEMYRKAPQKWESPRFLEVIVPGSMGPGDCHDQCAHWSRNDSVIFQTPICQCAYESH